MTIELNGKTILITGGLGGSAEFIVKRLSEAGAMLVVTDLADYAEGMRRLRDWEIPAQSGQYRRMDVTLEREVHNVIEGLFDAYPNIDTVLGHAGGCGLHPFGETPSEEYERIFRLNYHGQIYLTRAVLKEWLGRGIQGHMIYTSSVVSTLPWPKIAAYTSAKAALETFAKCLVLEYSDAGIRFNAIAPGVIAVGGAIKVYENDREYRALVDRATPLEGLVSPTAIADAFLWLCSPMAAEVTGQVIKVDRGLSLPKVG